MKKSSNSEFSGARNPLFAVKNPVNRGLSYNNPLIFSTNAALI